MNQRIGLLEHALFHFLPVKKQVLFIAFEGRQYGDNPRYIAQYIHEKKPEIDLFWAVDKKTKTEFIPNYLNLVQYGSTNYEFIKNRSSVIVSNGAGTMLMALDGKKTIYKRFIKKRGQFELSTWHGCPLKKIGADIPNSPFNKDNLVSSADVLIASSEYEKKIFRRAFLDKIPVDTLGYARNDCLFQHQNKNVLKQKLNIPEDKKVVLFAPTFRDDDLEMSGIRQLQSLDIDSLLRILGAKFGGEWVFVYRFHNLVFRHELMRSFIPRDNMIDGSISDDMADYLQVTNLLITDYSGSLFDILGTNIPCILLTPDLKEYCSKRGLYLDVDELPFPRTNNSDELIDTIDAFNVELYQRRVNDFAKKIGIMNDGCATKRVYDKYLSSRL